MEIKSIFVYESISEGKGKRQEKMVRFSLERFCLKKTTIFLRKILECYAISELSRPECFRIDRIPNGHPDANAAAAFFLGGLARDELDSLRFSREDMPWMIEIRVEDRILLFRTSQESKNVFADWAKNRRLI